MNNHNLGISPQFQKLLFTKFVIMHKTVTLILTILAFSSFYFFYYYLLCVFRKIRLVIANHISHDVQIIF